MDKLYKVDKFENIVELCTNFIHLYIKPDEDLILYFNNSPRYKLIHVYGRFVHDDTPYECEYYATVDKLTDSFFKPCSDVSNIVTFYTSTTEEICFDYISFPSAEIMYHIPYSEPNKKRSLFLSSVNPSQAYYDSELKRYVAPLPPVKSVNKIGDKLSLAKSTELYMKEHPSCGGKNNSCYVDNSTEPALVNLDDITPTPYCSPIKKLDTKQTYKQHIQVPKPILVENFEHDENDEDEEECPCKLKNKSNTFIYFTKHKFAICVCVVVLLFIILLTSLLYFKNY